MPEGMTFTQWITALQTKMAEVKAAAEEAEAFRVKTAAALSEQTTAQNVLATKVAELEAMMA